jgi:hypothetical protein
VIECGEVPTLVNGKVSREPANTEVGAVATYECDTDYSFKDERNTRTCRNDKTWSNEDLECSKFHLTGNVYIGGIPRHTEQPSITN